MICLSMPVPALTELTEFLYIFGRKKLLHSILVPPLLLHGGISPCSLHAVTAFVAALSCTK